MYNFFNQFKGSIFGLVVTLWGIALMTLPQLTSEATLELLFMTFSQPTLGIFFVSVGVLHITTRFFANKYYSAIANLLIAAVFLSAMLTHLYASVYVIAWVAFAGITMNLVINAFQILRDE